VISRSMSSTHFPYTTLFRSDGACVQLNATGGTSYSWSPITGLSNPNIANPIACPTANTTYTVIVTNANSCTATDSVTITLNPLPDRKSTRLNSSHVKISYAV